MNGRDLGVADHNFDSSPFGIVDVYGRAARISIINISDAEGTSWFLLSKIKMQQSFFSIFSQIKSSSAKLVW